MLQYTVVENTVVKYNKNREEYYTIPMYSTNAIEIKFILDDSWKEYVITAQISNGEKTYNLLLQNNTAFIPADITAGIWNVSIFGVKGEEKRNTTIPSDFCVVEEGFKSDGQPPIPPEPDLYQKLLSEIQKGIEIAQSVKNDADVGKFDGEDGNGIERIEIVNKVDKTATYKITFTDGSTFEYQVLDGQDGINGVNGVDGIAPTIGENGNWFIGDVDTGKPASVTNTGTETNATFNFEIPKGQDGSTNLPIASETTLGGVKGISKTTEEIPVAIDETGKMYVPSQGGSQPKEWEKIATITGDGETVSWEFDVEGVTEFFLRCVGLTNISTFANLLRVSINNIHLASCDTQKSDASNSKMYQKITMTYNGLYWDSVKTLTSLEENTSYSNLQSNAANFEIGKAQKIQLSTITTYILKSGTIDIYGR